MTDPRLQLFRARRAGAKARLIGAGMTMAIAEEWLSAWEGTSSVGTERDSFDFWERGRAWAARAFAAGQIPPSIES